MKRLLLAGLIVLLSLHGFGQQHVFKPVQSPKGRVIYPQKRMPSDYALYYLNKQLLTEQLRQAPDQFGKERSNVKLSVPMPDGSEATFVIYRTHPMSSENEKRYPGFLSFRGRQVDGPMTLRMDILPSGVYMGIYHTPWGRLVWQPYDNTGTAILYRVDKQPSLDFSCSVTGEAIPETSDAPGEARPAFSDKILRTFRLAFATTGEFSQYHITQAINNGTLSSDASDDQKKQAVLEAVVVIINRVNEVYETDLGIHLELISGTEIIYLDPDTDPYSNDDPSALLAQNQNTLDNVIGSANYDIGHVGTTGGGGLAGLGVVCRDGYKAKGETGLDSPIGDHYAIDFVAHEMGHQFGANHTFANYCSGNRNDATAVEPGSGSTIMAYAGVCSPNVQNFSDPFFHYVSIDEIQNYVATHDCSQHTDLSNNPPTASMGPSAYIPKLTPFVLEVDASDAEGDVLTYTFDQTDPFVDPNNTNAAPSPTNTTGPLFRSRPATEKSYRFFPQMSDIINGQYGNTWEVLPAVNRALNFKAVVRDNNPEGGQIGIAGITLSVDTTAGPFRMTSQTEDVVWQPGQTVDITWDVAGTNTGNVNTPTVDILLSIDNGASFTTVLASNVPNDGAETITVPEIYTPQARVMVRGHNNYFFDVSQGNIMIGNYEEYCSSYTQSTAVSIPDNDPNGIRSTIIVSDTTEISDISVKVDISHTYIHDLIIRLTSPSGTSVDLFNRNCSSQNDILVTFSDDGEIMNCDNMASGAVYQPVGNLSDFIGEPMNGTWTLFVSDNEAQDTGTLNEWTLTLCHMQMPVEKTPVEDLRLYPNPVRDEVFVSFNAGGTSQEITVTDLNGRLVYRQSLHEQGPVRVHWNTHQWASGIYLVRITDGDRISVRKLVVE